MDPIEKAIQSTEASLKRTASRLQSDAEHLRDNMNEIAAVAARIANGDDPRGVISSTGEVQGLGLHVDIGCVRLRELHGQLKVLQSLATEMGAKT